MKIINIEKLIGHNVIVMTGRSIDILKDAIDNCGGMAIIETQSEEFLDCLLESDIEFVLATARRFDEDGLRTFRLRVLSKEEAWENRNTFNMELRV